MTAAPALLCAEQRLHTAHPADSQTLLLGVRACLVWCAAMAGAATPTSLSCPRVLASQWARAPQSSGS